MRSDAADDGASAQVSPIGVVLGFFPRLRKVDGPGAERRERTCRAAALSLTATSMDWFAVPAMVSLMQTAPELTVIRECLDLKHHPAGLAPNLSAASPRHQTQMH